MELNRNKRATFEGVVIADANDKTITVLVETYKRHPLYGKRVKHRKKYYAHDENNRANVGDRVLISGARPMSKTKRWRLVKVLELAEVTIEEFQEALEEAEEAEAAEIEEIVGAAETEEAIEEILGAPGTETAVEVEVEAEVEAAVEEVEKVEETKPAKAPAKKATPKAKTPAKEEDPA